MSPQRYSLFDIFWQFLADENITTKATCDFKLMKVLKVFWQIYFTLLFLKWFLINVFSKIRPDSLFDIFWQFKADENITTKVTCDFKLMKVLKVFWQNILYFVFEMVSNWCILKNKTRLSFWHLLTALSRLRFHSKSDP
jgi:hypothetical protein